MTDRVLTEDPLVFSEIETMKFPVRVRRRKEIPPLRLSPASVAMFRGCRQQYKFQYLDGLADQFFRAKPYFTMGNHVHATLREFLTQVPVNLRTAKHAKEILRKHWRRSRIGFGSKEREKVWADKALSQIERFVEAQDISVEPLMVEVSLEEEISPGVLLRGRVDRVDLDSEGRLHIIDYKTGNMPEEIDWQQLQLYALILNRQLPYPVGKTSFYYLEPGVLRTSTITTEVLEAATWDLLVTAKEMQTEKYFPSNPGPACSRCDFKALCESDMQESDNEMQGSFELW